VIASVGPVETDAAWRPLSGKWWPCCSSAWLWGWRSVWSPHVSWSRRWTASRFCLTRVPSRVRVPGCCYERGACSRSDSYSPRWSNTSRTARSSYATDVMYRGVYVW